jgi:transposase InsO family protein
VRDLAVLLLHVLATVARLAGPGGVRAVVAESVLVKQQLLILNRSRKRSPRLRLGDRMVAGLCALLMRPRRLARVAIALNAATLLRFHRALVTRKYRRLFSSTPCPKKPGPKGPDQALIQAIVELKSRNPRFGCPRIARIISQTFGVDIDKNVVYRVLAKHYRPAPGGTGPSWLSFIGHTRDSLWSVDLFRCESIVLKSFWVMVVMDVFTRRIIGFGVEPAQVDGIGVCRMFNQARCGQPLPKRLSSDHEPLFRFYRWRANLRVLEIEELKPLPFVPRSRPFVERLIGTLRREYLDQTFFWNGPDLHRKLDRFAAYYNQRRVHAGLGGRTSFERDSATARQPANLHHFA